MKLPTFALTGTGVLGLAFLVLLAVVGIYVFFNKKELIASVNPIDPNNLANKSVNATVSAATGRDETLGGWFYDLLHSNPVDLPAKPATPSLDLGGF